MIKGSEVKVRESPVSQRVEAKYVKGWSINDPIQIFILPHTVTAPPPPSTRIIHVGEEGLGMSLCIRTSAKLYCFNYNIYYYTPTTTY